MPYKHMDFFSPSPDQMLKLWNANFLAAGKELPTCKISLFLDVSVCVCAYVFFSPFSWKYHNERKWGMKLDYRTFVSS